MRYYLPWSAARGVQTMNRLRRRLKSGAGKQALASTLFDLGEWSSLWPASAALIEHAATMVRVFAEDFEGLAPAAALILAGQEENVPCHPTARPLWLAVSETAGLAQEMRDFVVTQPYSEAPAWLERAMDAALAAVSTKH